LVIRNVIIFFESREAAWIEEGARSVCSHIKT
jgi:hypothetical protein